jgi:hypothetical protein
MMHYYKILSSLRSARGGEAVCVLSYYKRLFYTKPEVKALKKDGLVAEHQPKEKRRKTYASKRQKCITFVQQISYLIFLFRLNISDTNMHRY